MSKRVMTERNDDDAAAVFEAPGESRPASPSPSFDNPPTPGPMSPRDLSPVKTTENIDLSTFLESLRLGGRVDEPGATDDVARGTGLTPSQGVAAYKNGFGKPAIVVDIDIPQWPIYRIRKDVHINDKEDPNLMDWRRAGKVKNKDTGAKWSVDDIEKILGIAIAVPPGYDKNPEELVKLIPKLTIDETAALKKSKTPIPKQPDVQLFILWKQPLTIKIKDENGMEKDRDISVSWESRTGCRTLYKKHHLADEKLNEVARRREQGYRQAGGFRPEERRRMSTISVGSAGSTARPSEERAATENETSAEEKAQKEKKQEEERKKKSTGKPLSQLKAFEIEYRELEGIEPDAKLTTVEKGELLEAYRAFKAKMSKP